LPPTNHVLFSNWAKDEVVISRAIEIKRIGFIINFLFEIFEINVSRKLIKAGYSLAIIL
jgi:hypothetical protein